MTQTASIQGREYRVGDTWTTYRLLVGPRDAGPREASYQPHLDPGLAEWLDYFYDLGARSVEAELVREDGRVTDIRYNYQMEQSYPVCHREQTTVGAWKHTPKGGWKAIRL